MGVNMSYGLRRIGIIGAGKAATLHAEALRQLRSHDVELVGFACLDPTTDRAKAFGDNFDCAAMSVAELARCCEALVVAVPAKACLGVAQEVAVEMEQSLRAVLVETPSATTLDELDQLSSINALGNGVMVGANLLHTKPVQRFVSEMREMDTHHVQLSVTAPSRDESGVLMQLGCGFFPILTEAIGSNVEDVMTTRFATSGGQEVGSVDVGIDVEIRFGNGKFATANLKFNDGVAVASLEAASSTRVVRLVFWPVPTLELDGVSVSLPADELCGFREQMLALVEVALSPGLDVARSSLQLAIAAAMSARTGEEVELAEVPTDTSAGEAFSSN